MHAHREFVLLALFICSHGQLEVPDEYHNTPHVLQEVGLPDDEEGEDVMNNAALAAVPAFTHADEDNDSNRNQRHYWGQRYP